MREEIIKWLEYQMMYGDNISRFESALQVIFTDWNESYKKYEGKEEDQQIILKECKSLYDIQDCLNRHEWNFTNTNYWKSLYGR